jgi:hypothetical protein
MNNSSLVVGIVVVVAVIIAIALIVRAQRTQKLKSRFGPEYHRAVKETGSAAQAEAKLQRLENRVERYHIKPLSPEARADFAATWQTIQGRFVDDPRSALTEADRLIQQIMTARGYPVADFEQRAADVYVDHPLVVENYRAGHDISVRHAQGRASTEDMRQAMIHYRTLFAELADEPEFGRSASSNARVARA